MAHASLPIDPTDLDPTDFDQRTWLVRAGRPTKPGEPLNHPITAVSTFKSGGGRAYARDDSTAALEALEFTLGGLDGGQSLCFSSGLAAAAAVFDQVEVGSEVVIPDDCYQGIVHLAEVGATKGRWTLTRLAVDATDAWLVALQTARLVWLESPTNPLLTVADLETIGRAPRSAETLLAVDNTFATSLLQQPLKLGADIAMQSSTKFIGGHSDLLGGVLSATDPRLVDALRASRTLNGAFPGSLETFLALRGLRTMALRLDAAAANARELADRLTREPSVGVVRYPGFGTMISFDLADAEAADHLCESVTIISHATSLGSVESTIERRAKINGQEHLPAGLLRLSVGIEHLEDLWNDLRLGLR